MRTVKFISVCKNKKLLPFLIIFLLFFSQVVLAQSTGKIRGKVLSQDTNEPLVGANVLLVGTNQGAATGIDGSYIIINVRPGVYSVRFGFVGYQTKVIENVIVNSDQTTTLNITLEPTTLVGQEVVVVAKRPIVEFNQTSTVVSINKDDIQALPIQNLKDIVNLQAGVIDGHFRGGRLGEVQYQIDGVSITNPYNNSSILEIDRSIIDEVQVISGTFDAKYGQAMSGIVNTVLKSGSDRFLFSGEIYGGDYFTSDIKRYPHNNSFTPIGIQNIQLSISGPVGLPNTTFFLSGRRFYNTGFLFGQRRFSPLDKHDFEKKIFTPSGDNALIPLNNRLEWSGQGKITNNSLPSVQIYYQNVFNYIKAKSYNHAFRFNPEGTKTNYTKSFFHGLSFVHTLSERMFYKFNIRQNYFLYEDYVYKDLYDRRYLEAGQQKGDPNYEDGAIVQGVDLGRFKQETYSYLLKGELTWQATNSDYIESGFELQLSKITFGPPGFFISTTIDGVQTLQPREQYPKMPGLRTYHPLQFSAYIQDRIEWSDLVIRAGIRFELFDSRATIPSDLQNPANSISGAPSSYPKRTSIKTAFAPRLGFSYPLTAMSSVYFSYGHFYQLPGLGLLYDNADYSILDELQAGGISYGVMGNPDLKPEKTIQYEFGYKQAFSDFIGTQVAFFYKDIRDLLGVQFVDTYTAASYARFTNVDFGQAYGFTISLYQKDLNYFTSTLDYTLQYAFGNSSDPRETANRAAAGKDPRPRTISFNWDQRHTLNLTVVYNNPSLLTLSCIIRLGSGQPYTPEIGTGFGADLETNSSRKRGYSLVDLRAEKLFNFGLIDFSVFARITNLFNNHFVNGFVFANTGSPDYSLTPSVHRSALSDPSRFYEPRRIEFGFSFRSK
jgi:outer membrane receptor protein involved in Fe transport